MTSRPTAGAQPGGGVAAEPRRPLRMREIAVAEAADGFDRGDGGAPAKLASQPEDRELHPVGPYPDRVIPRLLKELVGRENAPPGAHEGEQEPEFDRREIGRASSRPARQ